MSNFPVESGGERPQRDPRRTPAEAPPQGDSSPSDHAEWQELFDAIEPGLRRFLASKLPQPADVDDCMQAVFVAMLRNRSPVVPAARRAWLYRVAANESALWWRNKTVSDRVMERHANNQYTVDTETVDAIETAESYKLAAEAIERLPGNAKQIVKMRISQSMTFQAIADQLQLPLGTVLTRMRRAMQRLRDELET